MIYNDLGYISTFLDIQFSDFFHSVKYHLSEKTHPPTGFSDRVNACGGDFLTNWNLNFTKIPPPVSKTTTRTKSTPYQNPEHHPQEEQDHEPEQNQ